MIVCLVDSLDHVAGIVLDTLYSICQYILCIHILVFFLKIFLGDFMVRCTLSGLKF